MNLPPAQPGVVIYHVKQHSPAYQQNLKPGQVITAVGQYRVDNLDDFDIVIKKYPRLPRVTTKY